LLHLLTIRAFNTEDSESILDIYKPFILEGPVTFETEIPSLPEFEQRLSGIAASFPFLVAEENGQILGYAYAGKYRERAAYRWHVETSIYLHESARGKGLGTQLYTILLNELEQRKFTRAYAIVGLPNPESKKLHIRCGFEPLVTHHNAGWKQGAWLDVLWLTKELHPCENPPAEPVMGELDPTIKFSVH
jgi:phosphinothricin acetyltransferase